MVPNLQSNKLALGRDTVTGPLGAFGKLPRTQWNCHFTQRVFILKTTIQLCQHFSTHLPQKTPREKESKYQHQCQLPKIRKSIIKFQVAHPFLMVERRYESSGCCNVILFNSWQRSVANISKTENLISNFFISKPIHHLLFG